ncbi:NAD(P)/FAD-dependent oxidoreductase [Haloglycomyces albus]|uniref:NAD(P)/FAD-dependent oxidoreductase n=1 Tax=Haloglycomyces albus TaxID=526067 RepID=UPI00046D3FA8|nr:NAD(P)/FAD-dependent oxidoreductase [Haloglycomyces albus]
MSKISADVAIIGAGPTGLFAAYYAGFRGLKTAIVDSLPEAGGQVTAMYPEKSIYDVGGFPDIKGRDLVDNLVEQAAPYDPKYFLGRRADTLEHTEDGPILGLNDGTEIACGSVIITAGLGNFRSRPLPAASEFDGDGIAYFVPELNAHADQDVVIVGGGDSAFDWALALHPIANSVTMVHRRDRFRAHERSIARVRDLGVPIHVNTEIEKIHGEERVSGVSLRSQESGVPDHVPADTIVAALGFIADLGPLREWGLELDRRHIIVDSTMATNVPRIFAAGDIADYRGKVRLIATGFGEAATAVNNAVISMDPSARLFPGHSSDVG